MYEQNSVLVSPALKAFCCSFVMHSYLCSLFLKTAFIGFSETFRDTFFFPLLTTPLHDVHYSSIVAVFLKHQSEKQWQVQPVILHVYVGPSYPYVIARLSFCL